MVCHKNSFPKSHKLDISVEPRQGKYFPWRYQAYSDPSKICFQSNFSSGLNEFSKINSNASSMGIN